MKHDEAADTPKKKDERVPNIGLIAAAALVMMGIILMLIAFNTARVDVNFLLFKVQNVQLWWFTLLVIIFTVITDRLIRFAFRLLRKKKSD